MFTRVLLRKRAGTPMGPMVGEDALILSNLLQLAPANPPFGNRRLRGAAEGISSRAKLELDRSPPDPEDLGDDRPLAIPQEDRRDAAVDKFPARGPPTHPLAPFPCLPFPSPFPTRVRFPIPPCSSQRSLLLHDTRTPHP